MHFLSIRTESTYSYDDAPVTHLHSDTPPCLEEEGLELQLPARDCL